MEYSLLFLMGNKKQELRVKNKTTRSMTICCSNNNGSLLIIKGKWFRNCGFNPGDRIEINTNKKGIMKITNKGSKYPQNK